jgi:sugar lactone lactonase YvrE
VVDTSGSIYLADTFNNRVRKITPDGIINTIAGTGTAGYGGDGGSATAAEFHQPEGVALDSSGNLYIADYANNLIRTISSDGMISTFAGVLSGRSIFGGYIGGFSGDGGPATSAQLNGPSGLATDGAGDLFLADTVNHRIREVTPDGIIHTAAGSDGPTGDPTFGPRYIAGDSAGNIYVSGGTRNVFEITSNRVLTPVAGNGQFGYSGDGGPATAAAMGPQNVALDSAGNLYIADLASNRVRKVATDGTISTIAGNGSFGFSGDGGPALSATLPNPGAIAVDKKGNVYIADGGNRRVRMVDTNGTINTVAGNGVLGFAGDGVATQVPVSQPSALAIDSAGNLYIGDGWDHCVRKVTADGMITTIAGRGSSHADGVPAVSAYLSSAFALLFDSSGTLYIADANDRRVREITPDGIISTVAGTGVVGLSGDGGPAVQAKLYSPIGLALSSSGTLFISDDDNYDIRAVQLYKKRTGQLISP